MTAKEYLSRLRSMENRIVSNANELERLSDIASSITSVINNENVQTTGTTSDKLGNCVAKIVDIQNTIDDDICRLEGLRMEIIEKIEGLDNQSHVDLLMFRYVNGMTFEEIAVEMGFSWRHTMRVHGHALAEFSKRYPQIIDMS